MDVDKCILCNAAIPEGVQVCPNCAKKAGINQSDTEAVQELRDIADILAITENADANIKKPYKRF